MVENRSVLRRSPYLDNLNFQPAKTKFVLYEFQFWWFI